MSKGTDLIAEERQRQVDVEGWTAEHDDKHGVATLAAAGAAYALVPQFRRGGQHLAGAHPLDLWPFGQDWWKPTNTVRDLVRAGALIAAAIDVELRRAD